MQKQTGWIYCYTYIPTQEKYIGQTVNFKKRQREHLNDNRTNGRFHNLLKKHYSDFIIEILEDNIPIAELDSKEQYYIQFYNSIENGFNLTPGGDGHFFHCNKYWKEHPEEMKEHIKKIQPLAAEAAKKWRENNPDLEQKRLSELHQKSKEWRENNPEIFQLNTKKAQEAAKQWRIAHPEEFENNRKKGVETVKKRVKLINTDEEFESASEAGRKYNICISNISACCRGTRKSAGKSKEGEKLIWKYI